MTTELTDADYTQILDFYNINIPKSSRSLKIKAKNILASKLCRCIKKVDTKNEGKSIGICTKTIINNKGYTRGKFTCKKKQTINIYKKIKNKTAKYIKK
jgi:hypothetical protein